MLVHIRVGMVGTVFYCSKGVTGVWGPDTNVRCTPKLLLLTLPVGLYPLTSLRSFTVSLRTRRGILCTPTGIRLQTVTVDPPPSVRFTGPSYPWVGCHPVADHLLLLPTSDPLLHVQQQGDWVGSWKGSLLYRPLDDGHRLRPVRRLLSKTKRRPVFSLHYLSLSSTPLLSKVQLFTT